MVQHLLHIQNLVTPEICYNTRRFRRSASPRGASGSGFGIFQPPPIVQRAGMFGATILAQREMGEKVHTRGLPRPSERSECDGLATLKWIPHHICTLANMVRKTFFGYSSVASLGFEV